ncbi:tRNA (adenosine(37)-N6)-dimethylallyltransferase MiaA [Lactobacillus sp. Sy-1]|uniref:tRNA (adenosine(37)-N6)-dimethylallyltransferase MiaA n=1 Tax=Lactobacillus sp. Sy-1 TaxID=2109645 RepID=UPI001C5A3A86|nr:tRNA (adenosine(37)-N6)-dimethylallyltransferase MiaA [Lactobacillus sp. Sy-1]MBW1605662.1 tRNA (adenosine(37)-N6)-dimethylallyltransferase MiaA [Lactobacillus sp. Sy-1]
MQKVLGIVGPTAVGKTTLSIQLAHQFNGEIISGDSMQVYRHLDIGTAKVTPTEMDGIVHHLINIKDVTERYSAADFVADARQLINEITNRGRLPIIAGGTGFYLQALLDNLVLGGDSDADQSIRAELHAHAENVGNEAIWTELKQIDPQAAAQIPVNNVRRVIRALEVYQKTGHRFSDQPQLMAGQYDTLLIGLNADRKLVYDRINQRVDLMFQAGLLDEARWLLEQGGPTVAAGKGIGYRELYPYLSGAIDLPTATAKIKQDSRHYAKRQLTWFRNKMNVRWFNVIEHPEARKQIQQTVSAWLTK